MRTLIRTLRRLLAVMPAGASRFLAVYSTQLGLLSILDAAALGPEEFRKLIENDVKRWKDVVIKSGIKLE